MQIYQVLNLDVTKFSILMRSKFSGSHASLNIVTLCSEYVCTCHDMTLYGRVTLLVHTGERIRVWYGRVSHGIFTPPLKPAESLALSSGFISDSCFS